MKKIKVKWIFNASNREKNTDSLSHNLTGHVSARIFNFSAAKNESISATQRSCGLHYKNITMVNDASRVVSQ
jgi:hypothetical protein